MSVWGHESFANEFAADWAFDLSGYDDLALVEGTLDAALIDEDEYVELEVGCEAMAAFGGGLRFPEPDTGCFGCGPWGGTDRVLMSVPPKPTFRTAFS